MGTDCHVLVHAPNDAADALAHLARERVDLLEQCWSRFRPDSELSYLNRCAGRGAVPVSPDLLLLVTHMREAWVRTGGLFDPTVLAAMTALGYDADFDTIARSAVSAINHVSLAAAPGMSGVLIDENASTIELPAGIGIDPGAIGKGLAADVVVDELKAAGATGVLVNLGGDVSIAGYAPGGEPWAIAVDDERRPASEVKRTLRILTFPAGTDRIGVATSTTLKRRWAQGRRHHVIDPRTGTMSTGPLVQATVVARTGGEAEVMATTALLMSAADAAAWLGDQDATGILLTSERELHTDREMARG